MKYAAKIDVSVLILFFNRPDHLQEVFAQVRQARPSRLFLYQDGSRGSRDTQAVEACRRVVSDEMIDWECQVYRLYQERNYGCDPSEYISQKWAFSLTDKCIVLEDDDVPSLSFFPFCKELLDRYEHDPRVWMIAGFNAEQRVAVAQSYFFTQVFSIWGWASWRRVVDTWDETYSWMDDPIKRAHVELRIREKGLRSDLMQMCESHKASGIAYYETIFWASMLLHDAVAVMSTENQIRNIGMSDNSTHFQGTLLTMPYRMRQMFLMPAHEILFPLRHPEELVEYFPFQKAVYLRNAWNNPWRKVQYSLEELYLNLCHANFRVILRSIGRRICKWIGKKKYV